ncbi:hypothetical protein HQ563_00240 [bacterium]|nr:hypothetical protein [bacterium]
MKPILPFFLFLLFSFSVAQAQAPDSDYNPSALPATVILLLAVDDEGRDER